ncbi:MAG: DUF924 domain-containing protein [Oligoflexia bacterium]|nr:DUF924 domain-containing protein [Oligoflexia bacterium]
MKLYKEIIEYWFSPRVSKLWFNSTKEFDEELTSQYESLLKKAIKGELKEWESTPEGTLALIIVLDQFPLNMYRGKAESYSTGDQAVAIAKEAVQKGFDQKIPKDQIAFLYLPFMHSEDLQDQEMSVMLFEKAGLVENLRFAKHHQNIVHKFGRFPHRNEALGRKSTEEELEYLSSKQAFKG